MKKLFSLLLALSIFACAPISADTIYENTSSYTVTRGVTHSYTERLTSSGWQKINLLTVDLSDENVDVITMYDQRGISYKTSVSTMAKQQEAAAGINADFFDTTTPAGRTSPLGLTANDGQILSSPAHDAALAVLYKTEGKMFADYFQMAAYAVAPNDEFYQILHINKYHSTGWMVMYTSDWGASTPGTQDGSYELVVSDGIVTDKRTYQDPAPIPEDGYVLRVHPSATTFLSDNFEIGSTCAVTMQLLPNDTQMDIAVGGGTLLVKDGQTAPFTNVISGSHPRTAAGVSADGQTLYMVTVEGRETNTPGMTQTELASLMLSIGAHTAINFDGGGSTEMVAKNNISNELEIKNTPSDGAERAVSTGLGVKSVGGQSYFSKLIATPAQEYVYLGDGVDIWCFPYDNYDNTTILEYELEFSADDGGSFVGNRYYPLRPGTRTIEVRAGNVVASATVHVMSEIENIYVYPDNYSGESASISVIAADSDGFRTTVSSDLVSWNVVSGNASVTSGNAAAYGEAVISATLNGKTAYCYANGASSEKTLVSDRMQNFVSSPSFVVLPETLPGTTFINLMVNRMVTRKALTADKAFSFSEVSNSTALTAFSYSYDESSAYIALNNNGTVYKNGVAQWQQLMNLKSSPVSNVFIFLSSGSAFSDDSEAAMFKNTLTDFYSMGKNVFVITKGAENSLSVSNGIRYLTLKPPTVTLSDFEGSTGQAQYLKFYVSGANVSYEFAKIMD